MCVTVESWRMLSLSVSQSSILVSCKEERFLLDQTRGQNSKGSIQHSFVPTIWISHREKQWVGFKSTKERLGSSVRGRSHNDLHLFRLKCFSGASCFHSYPPASWATIFSEAGLRMSLSRALTRSAKRGRAERSFCQQSSISWCRWEGQSGGGGSR